LWIYGCYKLFAVAEMNYRRKVARYIWTDYKTSREVAKDLDITPVLDKIQESRRNWLQHINRMNAPH
jgi:hypothetical protein